MEVETTYISCACNRTPHNADWGQNNLIVYGTSRAVAVTQPAVGLKAVEVGNTFCRSHHVGDNMVSCGPWSRDDVNKCVDHVTLRNVSKVHVRHREIVERAPHRAVVAHTHTHTHTHTGHSGNKTNLVHAGVHLRLILVQLHRPM